jgi:hypothetical protein
MIEGGTCVTLRRKSIFCGYLWTVKLGFEEQKERVSLYLHPVIGYFLYYPPGVGQGIRSKIGTYKFFDTHYPKIFIGRSKFFKITKHTIKDTHREALLLKIAAEEI